MRVVITGASGNVGTALLRRLAAVAEYDLVGISRRRPPQVAPYDTAEWHEIDIAAPHAGDALQTAFRGADAVVHLAWLIQPSRDREAMRRTNQDGTAAVARAAVDAGVPHLLHQSSVGAYAPGHGRTVDESWPVTGIPTSMYSVDKSAAEATVAAVADQLTLTVTRPCLIFQADAASEIKRYFLGRALPHLLLRRGVLRFAPLPREISFQAVHADDVAAAFDVLLRERAAGAFNIAAPPVIDRDVFGEIFGGVGPALPLPAVRALASASWRARIQPTEPGWLDLAAQSPTLDTARLDALGWRPARDGREVLSAFVDALRRGSGHPGPLLKPLGRTGTA
jgi:nucleoside-diphosphate-sugar epimerase